MTDTYAVFLGEQKGQTTSFIRTVSSLIQIYLIVCTLLDGQFILATGLSPSDVNVTLNCGNSTSFTTSEMTSTQPHLPMSLPAWPPSSDLQDVCYTCLMQLAIPLSMYRISSQMSQILK